MKKVGKWFKNQMAALAVSLSNVEKNALGQEAVDMDMDTGKFQRHQQGTLMDALINGEITEEVKNLRWRLYKVLNASDKIIVNNLGVDEEGFHKLDIEQPNSTGLKVLLSKVSVDEYDDYELEMVVDNSEITMSTSDIIDNTNITSFEYDKIVKETDVSGNTVSATLGEIDNDSYHSYLKGERPIKVIRDIRPKFEIEKFTKKLNVRKINESERLLEFYVSKYPDEYNRKSRLFLSELKRAINNPRASDILDIVGVGFTSNKTVGVKDFHQFQYKIITFDKIIEFNGYYVIKFNAEVILNGEYLLEKFRLKELDEKYKNKEKKK